MSDEQFMQMAVEQARQGDHPFGAVIVNSDGEVIAQAFNTIFRDCDPSAHGEMQTIRQLAARRERGRLERGLTIYTTCEPCPMCSGAIVWAGIERVVIGATIDDVKDTWRIIELPCEKIFAGAPFEISTTTGVLREECVELYKAGPLE